MAFDINRFKAKVFSEKYNGFSRPNLFMIRLSRNDNGGVAEDISFFCNSVTFPGINFSTVEYRPDSNGLGQALPVGINYSSINAVIMLDDNHRILDFFHKWMQQVYNYNTANKDAPIAGDATHFPHELGYKKEYTCTMDIIYFSATNPNSSYTCKLKGVYPYEISPLDLAWANESQISMVTVQFSYSSFEMQGATSGPPPQYFLVSGTNISIAQNTSFESFVSQYYNSLSSKYDPMNIIRSLF